MPVCPLVVVDDSFFAEREAKFLPESAIAHAFWAIATQHLSSKEEPGQLRYVRTTYFDTEDRAFYRSNGRRLRLREYACAAHADALPVIEERCFLELKESAGGRRSKTRLALRFDEVAAALAARPEAPLTPQMATWYRRRALVDAAGLLRVTFDERLTLCKPRPIGSAFIRPGKDDIFADGPSVVLEFKVRGAAPAWLVRALDGLQEEIGFSKFMLGMNALESANLDRDLLSVVACTG